MASIKQCTRALEKYQGHLSSLENVVGLGIVRKKSAGEPDVSADKQYVVAVYVSKKLDLERLKKEDIVPTTLDLDANKKGSVVDTCVIEQAKPEFELE